uniref:Uncharacterized protein n=1 Tax=Rhizophora mucronata TaxID=61149 RepID=A0A2P2QR49_RHIMU
MFLDSPFLLCSLSLCSLSLSKLPIYSSPELYHFIAS